MRTTTLLTAAAIGAFALTGPGLALAASPQSGTPSLGETAQTMADVMMQVSHAYAHLRKEPNTKSPIVATLKKGAKLTVLGKTANGKWAHVKADKLEGYVAVALLK